LQWFAMHNAGWLVLYPVGQAEIKEKPSPTTKI
jgi:hypothetical protein